ncbi:hypothetical protein DUI87_23499 [Hirundo rustica rustica]|uniref:RING-type domain-containing protein n=1 Tax=Hirundo rustica rustica TaxID=333673 RepID=A0A3M0JGV0_HIRRU|nr:hypothetical protein DUI87_23499 [Hirundo rustica rustica]
MIVLDSWDFSLEISNSQSGGQQRSSYCSEHRPEQDVQVTPEPGTECPICMEPVEERKTFQTMVCPACKRAWFHRDCIQGQAMSAGALCLHCPLCRDSEAFTLEMFIMGIRIPFRLVSSCLAHKTGGCRCCALPGPAPGVLALLCPVLLLSVRVEARRRWREWLLLRDVLDGVPLCLGLSAFAAGLLLLFWRLLDRAGCFEARRCWWERLRLGDVPDGVSFRLGLSALAAVLLLLSGTLLDREAWFEARRCWWERLRLGHARDDVSLCLGLSALGPVLLLLSRLECTGALRARPCRRKRLRPPYARDCVALRLDLLVLCLVLLLLSQGYLALMRRFGARPCRRERFCLRRGQARLEWTLSAASGELLNDDPNAASLCALRLLGSNEEDGSDCCAAVCWGLLWLRVSRCVFWGARADSPGLQELGLLASDSEEL